MYDMIIIGGGPAGLTAAIYAGRYKMKALLMARAIGGAMAEAHVIENFPGIEHIQGLELAGRMRKQAEHLGVEILEEEAVRLEKTKNGYMVNKKYETKYLVLCLGTERKKLNLERENEFIGKGVSYCATCDAPFYKEKIVAVVGGRDAALMAADLLTRFARKVYIIYRGDKLMAQPLAVERLLTNAKVEAIFNANVSMISGTKFLESVELDNGKELIVDGLFVEVGSIPSSTLAKEIGVKLDEDGCVLVDQNQQTNLKGIYAAGDITAHNAKWRQIVIACAEGALASRSIYEDTRKTGSDAHT